MQHQCSSDNYGALLSQILQEQVSISHLSILGRGELDFPEGPRLARHLRWAVVTFLTSLRIKTDWGASVFIPATMQLQSLELYALRCTCRLRRRPGLGASQTCAL